jgi:S1-C subfamily serine protease
MTIADLSASFAKAVETAGSAVVRVEARRGPPSSGVIWAEGIVVTADHAVEAEEDVTIGLPDGGTATASLVGRDPGTDLAVLKTDAVGLGGVAWSDDTVAVGHLALALWRPGRTVRGALALASAVAGEWRTPGGSRVERYLEADVNLRPGLSGGLLVAPDGKALGLITTGILRGSAVALPQVTITRVVNALLAHGSVPRGYLGVGVQPVRLPPALAAKTGQPTGVIVVAIQENGPAWAGGVHLGDVLLAVDGRGISHLRDLQGLLDEGTVGKSLKLRILRGDQLTETDVAVASRGER